MQTLEERLNLLKEACEEALTKDPEVLEGKKIEFSKKSGSGWSSDIFSEFEDVPDNSVRICITTMSGDMFRILMSKNMKWHIAGEYVTENIKKTCGVDTLVSYRSVGENILGFTVTF